MSDARRGVAKPWTPSAYAGVRVAVLGASGFIGRWVARTLTRGGADLGLVVRAARPAEDVFARFGVRGAVIETDLCELDALASVLERLRPSITFNLAGYGIDPLERDTVLADRTNSDLIASVCAAIARTRDQQWGGQHVVHTGSSLEYGVASGKLLEDSVPMPTTDYGRSKLRGTYALAQACRAFGLRGVTARLFNVYGPGEHDGRLLPTLLEAARSGTPVDLTTGHQRRDFAYVEDVAEGLLRLGCAGAQPGEIVNLATGRLTSVREFAETGARLLGLPSERLRFGAIPTRQSDMAHEEVVITRLIRLVDWSPGVSVEDGILRTRDFTESP